MRKALLVIGLILFFGISIGFIGIGTATAASKAEMATFRAEMAKYNANIAAARAKGPAIDKQRAQKMKAIASDYVKRAEQRQQELELEQIVATRAATAQADDGVVPAGRAFRRGLTAGLKIVFTSWGSFLVGAEQGVKYVSSSKLENPISRFCRGGNVALDQTIGNVAGCLMEMATPRKATVYADPSKLNPLAAETITWGPLAQVGRMAAYTIPAGMLATCGIAAIPGVSQAGSVLIYGASGYTAGGVLNKGVSFAEKYATKAVFGK